MDYAITSATPAKRRSPCLILGVFQGRRQPPATAQVDEAGDGYISAVLRRGDISGKPGQTLLLSHPPSGPHSRVLLVGLGRAADLDERRYRQACAAAITALNGTGISEACSTLPLLEIKGRELAARLRIAVESCGEGLYRFDAMKSKPAEARALRRLTLHVPTRGDIATGDRAVAEGRAVANGVTLARDLGNLPGNVCHPEYLAERARALAAEHDALRAEVLEEAALRELGMGALLAVAQGSSQPPRLIALHYRGGAEGDAPVVLVGKGVTFDSGGISLKPGAEMDEMKFDMCGAASVLGTLQAVAELGLPINVTGLIPAVENMPGGNATRPGDVVTTLAGKTVEILNTDAEGRLILCDALSYAERYRPRAIIDIATLTGACVIALGRHPHGLFSNHPPLAQALLRAGRDAGDRAWELPLWDEYQELLDSNFADMANIGGREGGAITAACFLSRFVSKQRWAHLDIAGTAWKSGKAKGATGRPVPLLVQYLLDQAANAR